MSRTTPPTTGLAAVEAPGFRPLRLLEVELSRPLSSLEAAFDSDGQRYRRARALVRLHGQPLGLVDLALDDGSLSAAACGRQIWLALESAIQDHRRRDGLPPADHLGPGGLADDSPPVCLREREAFLARAPLAGVIVATHERPDSLSDCLSSLLALDYPAFEIVVVDNAPRTPATADLIARRFGGTDRVRYVREDRPGLARAHNRGLAETRAACVAFTDDDVIVDRGWLTELMRGFERGERVGCVTGMILPLEIETQAQEWLDQFGGFGKGFGRRIFQLDSDPTGPLYPYAAGVYGSGANMAFTRSALRAIGGFDPALGAGTPACGGDDLAAFFAVIAEGRQLVYEPAALLRHRHRRSYGELRRQAYGYGVGLGAYLTGLLLDRPGRLPGLATRLPAGLTHLLDPRSSKNARKAADYPAELTRLERRGLLAGPLAYLRSRRQGQSAAGRVDAARDPLGLQAAGG